MSSIIKSSSVVDDRPMPERFSLLNEPDSEPVIKWHALGGTTVRTRAPLTQDSALEELNRVRVQVAEAQQELREQKRLVEEARQKMEALEAKRKELEQLEDLDVDEQAKAILQNAERQAERMVEWAQTQAAESVDQLKAQGYLDGLEQGASEAREQFRMERAPEIGKLERLMEELSDLKAQMLAEQEGEIVSLIMAVAGRVIGERLKEKPETVANMLRDVMEQNRRAEFIKVTISADLLPAEAKVSGAVREAIQRLGRQVDVAVDAEAAPHTVVVETPGGFVDLSVPTQLENLRKAIQSE